MIHQREPYLSIPLLLDMFSVIFGTFPDGETARSTVRTLVEERLIACGSILPCTSIYTWEEKVEENDETMVVMKTRSSLADEVVDRIVSLHPYDVPEAISVDIGTGHLPYLEWVADSTREM